MAEFSASYTVIIQHCTDVSHREALISQFHYLMDLASTYTWSAVCAYHYKVLRSIEMGFASCGILLTCSSSLFSYQPLSSWTQLTKHKAALPPDSLQAPLLATSFLAVKSVMPGPGTMTTNPIGALSVTCTLCASAITKLKPVQKMYLVPPHCQDPTSQDWLRASSTQTSVPPPPSLPLSPGSTASPLSKGSVASLAPVLPIRPNLTCHLISAYQTAALSRTKRLYPSSASTLWSLSAQMENSVTRLPRHQAV